jgi:hypothetical protein
MESLLELTEKRKRDLFLNGLAVFEGWVKVLPVFSIYPGPCICFGWLGTWNNSKAFQGVFHQAGDAVKNSNMLQNDTFTESTGLPYSLTVNIILLTENVMLGILLGLVLWS